MAQHENYSFLPFSRFQEEAHRKTPYIVGGIHPKIEHILPLSAPAKKFRFERHIKQSLELGGNDHHAFTICNRACFAKSAPPGFQKVVTITHDSPV
jgi:hypothetical protein